MKIVIDAREYATSTGYYVKWLLEGLKKIDTTNHYIVLMKPEDLAKFPPTDNFEAMATRYKEFTFGEQLGFLQQIRSLHADLVHFPAVQQPILYRGKVVTTFQDLTTIRFRNPTKNPIIFWIKQQVYKFVNWYVARKSSLLLTPTEFVRQDVAQYTGISPDKITATHEAIAIPEDATEEPIPSLEGKQFIMYVGRPQPHKNLHRLMKAHARLLEKHPDLLLVLAGKKDRMYDSYARLAEELGTTDKVLFPGWVTDGQKRWLMSHTAVFVAATLSEGFFISGIDAMWCGTPVASSNASCLPEVHGEAAHYFDPYDVDDMARAIDEVMTGKTLRDRLIAAGYENIKRFSWEKMARQTLDVYEKAFRL
jgi:glycosyltransferase involved in cell wall biosynthesis